jgi:hypothetical protein
LLAGPFFSSFFAFRALAVNFFFKIRGVSGNFDARNVHAFALGGRPSGLHRGRIIGILSATWGAPHKAGETLSLFTRKVTRRPPNNGKNPRLGGGGRPAKRGWSQGGAKIPVRARSKGPETGPPFSTRLRPDSSLHTPLPTLFFTLLPCYGNPGRDEVFTKVPVIGYSKLYDISAGRTYRIRW